MGAFRSSLPVFVEFGATEEGRAWLATLPDLVASLEREWQVRTEAPFVGGSASWVAPAVGVDGRRAVLKVSFPHREAREEPTGFELWAGRGAVRLYQADRERYALLIEECRPGVTLERAGLAPEDALAIAAGVLSELWAVAPPPASTLEQVADVTAEWAEGVRNRFERLAPGFDQGLVELGAELLETLPATASRSVVVHGDFNPGNVVSAERAPWLAIDAKPMIGDPGYDPSPLLLQVDSPLERPDARDACRQRFGLFAQLIGEPEGRLFAWAVARVVEAALWYVSRDDLSNGQDAMAAARLLADVGGL